MIPRLHHILVPLLVLTCGASHAESRVERNVIEWPSEAHRTLQNAVDAAEDGDTIRISHGVHTVFEPVEIDTRVTIRGAGSGKGEDDTADERVTRLEGPGEWPRRSEPTVDAFGAIGLLNYVGAGGGQLEDLAISGGSLFDAAVKGHERGTGGGLLVDDVVLEGSDRGILWLADSPLVMSDSVIAGTANGMVHMGSELSSGIIVTDVTITDLLGHAVIVIGSGGTCDQEGHLIENVTIHNAGGAGIVLVDGGACVVDSLISICGLGGVWAVRSAIHLEDSTVGFNTYAGFLASDSHVSLVNNHIGFNLASSQGLFGDGVILFDSTQAKVFDNEIVENARAGVVSIGGITELANNEIGCNPIDLVVDGGVQLVDLGGNACGCPATGGACSAKSVDIAPPNALDPTP